MTEVQARRCLDYLDGARHVLAGNMKKVASTMYLLTPVNVVVNIGNQSKYFHCQPTNLQFQLHLHIFLDSERQLSLSHLNGGFALPILAVAHVDE